MADTFFDALKVRVSELDTIAKNEPQTEFGMAWNSAAALCGLFLLPWQIKAALGDQEQSSVGEE